MSQAVNKFKELLQKCSNTVVHAITVRRKRRRSIQSNTNSEDEINNGIQPKKKRLLTTTQYIYQALFKEEKSSDISIMALGKIWKLHKVYLCQSPYFASMFNGVWKEARQDLVNIQILDDNITINSLDAVFGSLYSDEIEIDGNCVVEILAAATIFQLEGIISQCRKTMLETINVSNVIKYYEASLRYGCIQEQKMTYQWLEINLLSLAMKHLDCLQQINIELMTSLVSSPNLYVMQTEFSLYTLLKTWMFLLLRNDNDTINTINSTTLTATVTKSNSTISSATNENFSMNVSSSDSMELIEKNNEIIANFYEKNTEYDENMEPISFLLTKRGNNFYSVFRALRTQYLIHHQMDLKIITNDNIIPKEWINSHVLTHWSAILKIDHMPEDGPQNLSLTEFDKHSMRFGRILIEPGYHKWRWTGFNYGLDLILIADSRALSIRRHHRNEHERLLSLQTKRKFMIRASVTSINSQRQPIYTQQTELYSLNLEKNEEVTLMLMDNQLVHPLLIAVYILPTQPVCQNFKDQLQNYKRITELNNSCSMRITEFGTTTVPDKHLKITLPNNNNQHPNTGTRALAISDTNDFNITSSPNRNSFVTTQYSTNHRNSSGGGPADNINLLHLSRSSLSGLNVERSNSIHSSDDFID